MVPDVLAAPGVSILVLKSRVFPGIRELQKLNFVVKTRPAYAFFNTISNRR